MHPFAILAIGIVTVIGMIIVLRINAFIALISAAIVVSLLSPGETAEKISRVAAAFGDTAGKIGIVIALAAVIGSCMMDSGAADRIVRSFLRLLGQKRASFALMGSGFILSVPVFFDTVFYLLVPLARSLFKRTGSNYLMYLLAITAGGAITHTLVPPTPGPLVMADNLGVEIGTMIIVGALVALPAALAGIAVANIIDRVMPLPMRPIGNKPEPEPIPDEDLPPLLLSALPVVLPVLMISTNTIVSRLATDSPERWSELAQYTAIIGDANLALLASGAIAIGLYFKQRRPTLGQMSEMVETALMSGGAIILITAGGGAFGAMLKVAEIGPRIETRFSGWSVLKPEQFASLERTYLERDDDRGALAARGSLPETETYQVTTRASQGEITAFRLEVLPSEAEQFTLSEFRCEIAPVDDPDNFEPVQIARAISDSGGNVDATIDGDPQTGWTVETQSDKSYRARFVCEPPLAFEEPSLLRFGLVQHGGGSQLIRQFRILQTSRDVESLGQTAGDSGMVFLWLGFGVALLLKVAQGSSTVAMITASAMLAAMISDPGSLGYHLVYLATAIGAGSLVGSWMNDSGFWIFAKMGGLTEVESLKSWTILLAVMGVVAMAVTVLLVAVWPAAIGT